MAERDPSGAFSSEELVDKLFPKVLANHVSKLPESVNLEYGVILDAVSDPRDALADRLHRVARTLGHAGLTDSLVQEATILKLCATGQEAEVENSQRLAAYTESDINQLNTAVSSRNLDYFLQNGIEVFFDEEAREAARQYCAVDDRDVPLIEKLKTKRLVTINGFKDSRVMHTVHDLIDHAWLFEQMRQTGIMERYDDFLSSINMEDTAFLYSRQAELLASVGFGSRRWQVASTQGEELILNQAQIGSILQSLDDPRTVKAHQLLNSMDPQRQQQTVFMIENMAIQFADERRRWGAVKQTDSNGVQRPMELFDPLHIALMIETLDMLQGERTYDGIQLAASVEVNDMLETVLSDSDTSSGIRIPVPRSANSLALDKKDHAWIQRHLGVSTSYNPVK